MDCSSKAYNDSDCAAPVTYNVWHGVIILNVANSVFIPEKTGQLKIPYKLLIWNYAHEICVIE